MAHEGVNCSQCGMDPIQGIRYKNIEDERVNLCQDCEAKSKSTDVFLKIRSPDLNA